MMCFETVTCETQPAGFKQKDSLLRLGTVGSPFHLSLYQWGSGLRAGSEELVSIWLLAARHLLKEWLTCVGEHRLLI